MLRRNGEIVNSYGGPALRPAPAAMPDRRSWAGAPPGTWPRGGPAPQAPRRWASPLLNPKRALSRARPSATPCEARCVRSAAGHGTHRLRVRCAVILEFLAPGYVTIGIGDSRKEKRGLRAARARQVRARIVCGVVSHSASVGRRGRRRIGRGEETGDR